MIIVIFKHLSFKALTALQKHEGWGGGRGESNENKYTHTKILIQGFFYFILFYLRDRYSRLHHVRLTLQGKTQNKKVLHLLIALGSSALTAAETSPR